MKKNEKDTIKTKTIEELRMAIKDARQALFTMHIDHVRQKLKNTSALSRTRNEIARMLTLLQEKEKNNANH